MIDRVDRTNLVAVIRQFLNEELTAFEFDEALDNFHGSGDATVRAVAAQLWLFYDDCDDHLVVLTKPQWDYVQRVLLGLLADFEVATFAPSRLHFTQLMAAALLIGCLFVALAIQPGPALLVSFIPFGLGSLAISRFRRPDSDSEADLVILAPFVTIADIRAACQATGFRKEHVPSLVWSRTIRRHFLTSPVFRIPETVERAVLFASWICLAPIPLFVQCLPFRDSELRFHRASDACLPIPKQA